MHTEKFRNAYAGMRVFDTQYKLFGIVDRVTTKKGNGVDEWLRINFDKPVPENTYRLNGRRLFQKGVQLI